MTRVIMKPSQYKGATKTRKQALSLKVPAVLQIALPYTQVAIGVQSVSDCVPGYDFTRFKSAENHTSQDHFRCVMVCYCTRTP